MVHRSRSLTTSLGQTSFRIVLAICAPFSTRITSMEKRAYAKEGIHGSCFRRVTELLKLISRILLADNTLVIGTCGTS